MLTVERVDTTEKKQVRRFVDVPFRLYAGHPHWVPPIRSDVELALNRDKHPFYEHSTAAFFIARRDDRDVGRIAALENLNYNAYHGTRTAQFYYFDCEDDAEAAAALFERVFEWARARHLDKVVGPKGFSPFDGYGMLERGFEHRQMMNMMNYNYPYYLRLVEELGFEKEVDFISHYLAPDKFQLDERIHRIAEWIRKRSNLDVIRFRNKRHLKQWVDRIGQTYNDAFVENWEYVPLTPSELDFVVDNIMLVANPKLIKIIAHEERVVGFAFGWPDVSAAMQRSKGKLFPFGIVDLLLEMRRTNWLAGNGMGILPEYQGRGGNALLYTELEKTVRESGFEHCELTQIAETAEQMRNDLRTLGGEPYKNHRVFRKQIA
ncbi:MAG: GNAT family N-acetyltransferase [Candidatus Promineifilaceae bacterium]|nr:GNAT family N-acetyltransferase [Candidatus Promineifilaceae bacterium]